MIVLDTSGLFALANRRDPGHGAAVSAMSAERPPYLVPAGILAEAAYLLEHRLGPTALDPVLANLQSGGLTLDCGEGDFGRIRELVARYADLPLGFADASVVACAERNGGRVLTLDRRDFGVVARDGALTILPD